jgi:membrane-bound ClpP family serine protease
VTPIGPNTAFVLLIFGLFAIYGELVWPGCRVAKVIGPGVLGLGAFLAGGYFLWQHSPSPAGLALLGVAAVLFAAEAIVNTYFMAGIFGTAAMTIGFQKLFDDRPGIQGVLGIPLCIVFGIATMTLCFAAKLARRNKRIDL